MVCFMSLTIDCASCRLQETDACNDCVVSFIVDREPTVGRTPVTLSRPREAIVVDAASFAAMKRLQSAGLVPGLRHEDIRHQAS